MVIHGFAGLNSKPVPGDGGGEQNSNTFEGFSARRKNMRKSHKHVIFGLALWSWWGAKNSERRRASHFFFRFFRLRAENTGGYSVAWPAANAKRCERYTMTWCVSSPKWIKNLKNESIFIKFVVLRGCSLTFYYYYLLGRPFCVCPSPSWPTMAKCIVWRQIETPLCRQI